GASFYPYRNSAPGLSARPATSGAKLSGAGARRPGGAEAAERTEDQTGPAGRTPRLGENPPGAARRSEWSGAGISRGSAVAPRKRRTGLEARGCAAEKRSNQGGPGRTPTPGPAATKHAGHVIGSGQGLHDGESDRSRRERLPAHYRDQRCGRDSRHGAFAV